MFPEYAVLPHRQELSLSRCLKSPSPLYWKHESKVIPELSRGIPVSLVLEDTKADVKLAVPA